MSFCEWCRMDPVTAGLDHLQGCANRSTLEHLDDSAKMLRASLSASALASSQAFAAARHLTDLLGSLRKDSPVLLLRMADPVVTSALAEAERQEQRGRISRPPFVQDFYQCPGCNALSSWGGALFLHLVECPSYKKLVDDAAPEFT